MLLRWRYMQTSAEKRANEWSNEWLIEWLEMDTQSKSHAFTCEIRSLLFGSMSYCSNACIILKILRNSHCSLNAFNVTLNASLLLANGVMPWIQQTLTKERSFNQQTAKAKPAPMSVMFSMCPAWNDRNLKLKEPVSTFCNAGKNSLGKERFNLWMRQKMTLKVWQLTKCAGNNARNFFKNKDV